MSPSQNPHPRKPNGKKKGARSDKKDHRLLETAKMVRAMFPVTINGYAVAKIFENEVKEREKVQREAENCDDGNFTEKSRAQKRFRLTKKMKQDLICSHIKKVIDRDASQAIYLSFMMKPEDPDFPFDIETLNFNLAVPAAYARDPKAIPQMIVLNTDIPRGFSINVEKGFAHIANLARNPSVTDDRIELVGKGLLGQVQTLNKYLDLFLSQEKRETMKFVTFKAGKKEKSPEKMPQSPKPVPQPVPQPIRVSKESQSRRSAETEEMCHKLEGFIKLFNKSANESRYKVQVPIWSSNGLPVLWSMSESIDLFIVIPAEYPDSRPRVTAAANFSNNLMVAKKKTLEAQKEVLIDVVGEYKRAEANLAANATLHMKATDSLLQLLNFISNNLAALTMDKSELSRWTQSMHALKPVGES